MPQRRDGPISKVRPKEFDTILSIHNATEFTEATYQCIVTSGVARGWQSPPLGGLVKVPILILERKGPELIPDSRQ